MWAFDFIIPNNIYSKISYLYHLKNVMHCQGYEIQDYFFPLHHVINKLKLKKIKNTHFNKASFVFNSEWQPGLFFI